MGTFSEKSGQFINKISLKILHEIELVDHESTEINVDMCTYEDFRNYTIKEAKTNKKDL